MAEEKQKRRGCGILGCIGIILLIVAAFVGGVLGSRPIQVAIGRARMDPKDISPTAPEHPYAVRTIVKRKEETGKWEVYVLDTTTGQARRLNRDLQTEGEEVIEQRPLLHETRKAVESVLKKDETKEKADKEKGDQENTEGAKEKEDAEPAQEKQEPEQKPSGSTLLDIQEHPEKYAGKTVKVRGKVARHLDWGYVVNDGQGELPVIPTAKPPAPGEPVNMEATVRTNHAHTFGGNKKLHFPVVLVQ